MSYWLFKEEPGHYCFNDLVNDKTTVWDGVRNNLALKHLREVKQGDLAYFYHTGKEKSIVGVMKVIKSAYPDPQADNARFVVVDVQAVRPLKQPVTLKQIKEDPQFEDFAIVRFSRLSVMPVSTEHWNALKTLGA